jgi:group I intron endonuclease
MIFCMCIKNISIRNVIYLITNIIDGKRYVGKTTQTLAARVRSYKSEAKNYSSKKTAILMAIRKYGIENFTISVIDQTDDPLELAEKEKKWILILNTYGHGGYNETVGGEGVSGFNHKPETKKKISQNHKGKNTGKDNFKSRPVINLSKNKTFDSAREAGALYGCEASNIYKVCIGKGISCKGDRYMYKEDFDKLTPEQQQIELNTTTQQKQRERRESNAKFKKNSSRKKMSSGSPVRELFSNTLYVSEEQAVQDLGKFGVTIAGIKANCKGKHRYTRTFRFMLEKDFQVMALEEQEKQLSITLDDLKRDTRNKLSTSHLGQETWMKGRKHTEETKKKMSENKIGKYTYGKCYKAKPVIMDRTTIFDSIKQASETTNIKTKDISAFCRSLKQPLDGTTWEFYTKLP